MAIEISCRFIGGPQGSETLKLHQFHCLDQLSLEISWAKPAADGNVVLMKGQRPRNIEWLVASQAVYQKVSPISGGEVTYEFVRLEEVRRCEAVIESKDRLCRHTAAAGSTFCNTHKKP
ncbi:MAG: CCCH zinc finger protein [Pseudomonadota bacterium]